MREENRPVVRHHRRGGAVLDFDALIASVDQEARARERALGDMARLGMGSVGVLAPRPPTPGVPPRTTVRPPEMPTMAAPGLGDLHTQLTEPGQRYWERWETGRARPAERAVARPRDPIPVPPGMEQWGALIERTLMPYMALYADDLKQKLVCGTYFFQPQTHLEPPITAICVDVFTRARGVAIPANPVAIPVVSIDVPDRWLVVLWFFGNGIEAGAAPGAVRFSMQRNKTPLRCYADFDVSLGDFAEPTKFGSPIILKSKDRFRLIGASADGLGHSAFARFIGYAFAMRTTTSDGSYNEFHTE